MNVLHHQMVQRVHIYIYTRQHLIIFSHVDPRSLFFFISQPIKIFLHSTREVRPRIILDLHATIPPLPRPPSTQHILINIPHYIIMLEPCCPVYMRMHLHENRAARLLVFRTRFEMKFPLRVSPPHGNLINFHVTAWEGEKETVAPVNGCANGANRCNPELIFLLVLGPFIHRSFLTILYSFTRIPLLFAHFQKFRVEQSIELIKFSVQI